MTLESGAKNLCPGGYGQVRGPTKRGQPEELHARLREAADTFGLPINFIVVKAMEEFLDRLIGPSELRLSASAGTALRPVRESDATRDKGV